MPLADAHQVDCLSEWGTRLGVSPFYVSFVLAPFASNASELLSAYTYACKKTQKNITTSLSTLVGAACMNNTFVLGIFLALIYLQGRAWVRLGSDTIGSTCRTTAGNRTRWRRATPRAY